MIPFGFAGALHFTSMVVDEEASTQTPCGRLGPTAKTQVIVINISQNHLERFLNICNTIADC